MVVYSFLGSCLLSQRPFPHTQFLLSLLIRLLHSKLFAEAIPVSCQHVISLALPALTVTSPSSYLAVCFSSGLCPESAAPLKAFQLQLPDSAGLCVCPSGCQSWCISPVLSSSAPVPVFVLSAFRLLPLAA